jgi:ectoine hydroxylase-related dioxygenase (phytanoyl-CoA dioxygenase family)
MNLSEVKIYKCPSPSFYNNRRLSSSINLLLDLPDVVNRSKDSKYDSAYGNVLTSAGNEYSDIIQLPGSEELVFWVKEKILEYKNKTNLKFLRTWCNMMFEGSEGLVHAHLHPDYKNIPTEFVAIFYVQLPMNGSQLLFVDDGEFNTHYRDYDKSKLHFMNCEEGDLLIHPPHLPHAVSVHNSKTPRICFVFEGIYV